MPLVDDTYMQIMHWYLLGVLVCFEPPPTNPSPLPERVGLGGGGGGGGLWAGWRRLGIQLH